jgi:hypothetical protein
MGFLNIFPKSSPRLLQLPAGSFTVDRSGSVLTRTLPSSYPAELIQEVAHRVLQSFREASAAQLPLSQLIINYPSLKIVAREMRGGAIIFFAPRNNFPAV